MKTRVTQLSDSFLSYLRQKSLARRIAPLNLACRIDNYLAKEFMQFIFHQSNGHRFCKAVGEASKSWVP
jgi:hypothetical protein